MPTFRSKLRHLVVPAGSKSEQYASPKKYFPKTPHPIRDTQTHAAHLLSQLNQITNNLKLKDTPPETGVTLEFESSPGFGLASQSLDLPSKGMELLNIKNVTQEDQQKTTAVIYMPNEKIGSITDKILQYRDKVTKTGKPKNNTLVSSINNITVPNLKSLWTDLDELFPELHEAIWWEVWLRAAPDSTELFRNATKSHEIHVSTITQEFYSRYVLLAYATPAQLSSALHPLSIVTEVRLAKAATSDFLNMRNTEQSEWTAALLGLIDAPQDTNLTVVILDSGITNQHPLISSFLTPNNLHAYNPEWGTHDHLGHGTTMAGLALYGDLTNVLTSIDRIKVPCHLESVKILPPAEQNHPDLYGKITEEAVSLATRSEPTKNRIICMAICSTDNRDRGQPSSWSAAIDKICSGQTIKDKRHLFIVSSGNSPVDNYINYPDANLTDGIHDPGQSWNALTVGAYTEKVNIREPDLIGWQALAEVGNIAPANTTSLVWDKKWPIKPDVVFEGGNAAIDSTRERIDLPESLALLSTHHMPHTRIFTHMTDTSAAAAQIANMAAVISESYPKFWPETTRGLIVHSANWTTQMLQTYPSSNRQELEYLLRICGYGVPSLERALWSASNSLTLIVQDELKPFNKKAMNELKIHDLPWPKEVLESLGETLVKMRVTLSYFIEPNPARRGWDNKFRYQSHGLRFDVKTPTETKQQFLTRINKMNWDENLGSDSVTSAGDTSEWLFGQRIRSRGSIHSDTWEGTAASLAERGHIVVFPVGGWWKDSPFDNDKNKSARYSLTVTISTPELSADIYTPVEIAILNQIVI